MEEELQSNQLKLIKIDVEGFEPEVLKDALGKAIEIVEFFSIDCGFERNGRLTLDLCKVFFEQNYFEILEARIVSNNQIILVAKNMRVN